jgi:hypothetical protein
VTQLSCHLSKEIAVSFLLAMSHSHLSLKFSPPLFYRGTQISMRGPRKPKAASTRDVIALRGLPLLKTTGFLPLARLRLAEF